MGEVVPARTSPTLHPPIPSHCASIVVTSTLMVKTIGYLYLEVVHSIHFQIMYNLQVLHFRITPGKQATNLIGEHLRNSLTGSVLEQKIYFESKSPTSGKIY